MTVILATTDAILGKIKMFVNEDYSQGGVQFWSDIKSIVSHGKSTLGITSDGKVCIEGYGTIFTEIDGWSGVTEIAMGNNHIVGLTIDGQVLAVGNNTYGECDVNYWSDIKQP